jgi:hypothetical protein
MATYFPMTDGMGTEDWTLDGCGVTDVSFCVRFHQGDAGSYTDKTSFLSKLEYSAKDIYKAMFLSATRSYLLYLKFWGKPKDCPNRQRCTFNTRRC